MVSIAVVRWRERFPCLLTGWLWYLVTTLPVIGLVQVGMQSRADRYMYIPMIGLAIATAWGAACVIRLRPAAQPWAVVTGVVSLVALAATTERQTEYWHDSEKLFNHAIAVTERNALAYKALGTALATIPTRWPDAIAALREMVRLSPDAALEHSNLAALLKGAGQTDEAMREISIALRIDPADWRLRATLGSILQSQGKTDQAIVELRAAIRAMPSAPGPHASLGLAMASAGRFSEAAAEYEEALRLNPDLGAIHGNLSEALLYLGDKARGQAELEAALEADPNNAAAHLLLGSVLHEMPGRLADSIDHLQRSVRLDPGNTSARVTLAQALGEAGRIPEAVAEMRVAVEQNPDPKLADVLRQLEAMQR